MSFEYLFDPSLDLHESLNEQIPSSVSFPHFSVPNDSESCVCVRCQWADCDVKLEACGCCFHAVRFLQLDSRLISFSCGSVLPTHRHGFSLETTGDDIYDFFPSHSHLSHPLLFFVLTFSFFFFITEMLSCKYQSTRQNLPQLHVERVANLNFPHELSRHR